MSVVSTTFVVILLVNDSYMLKLIGKIQLRELICFLGLRRLNSYRRKCYRWHRRWPSRLLILTDHRQAVSCRSIGDIWLRSVGLAPRTDTV